MGRNFLKTFLINILAFNIVFADSNLDEIVITPKRPSSIFDSLTAIEIITSEEIEKYGFDTVDNL